MGFVAGIFTAISLLPQRIKFLRKKIRRNFYLDVAYINDRAWIMNYLRLSEKRLAHHNHQLFFIGSKCYTMFLRHNLKINRRDL